jgi:hypothetical protein
MSNDIVRRVLTEEKLKGTEEKVSYICLVCHLCLREKEPRYPKHLTKKKKEQKHEHIDYICTCCHKITTHRNAVVEMHVKKYDFSNPCVKEALSKEWRVKEKFIEYICRSCHQCLLGYLKKGRMPTVPDRAACLRGDKRMKNNLNWNCVLKKLHDCISYEELVDQVKRIQLPDLGEKLFGNRHRNGYDKDCLAYQLIPDDCPIDKINCLPVYTVGDGACFMRALSRICYGNEDHNIEMRVRVVCEGVKNMKLYLNSEYLRRGYISPYRDNIRIADVYCSYGSDNFQGLNTHDFYQKEVMSITKRTEECGIWQFHQAASVIGCPIYSVYPDCPLKSLRRDMNRCVLPADDSYDVNNITESAIIMWSKMSTASRSFNHFVPLVR